MLYVLAFIISIIPAVLLYILLRRRKKDDTLYKKKCTFALFSGMISVLPILIVSGTLFFLNGILKLVVFKGIPTLLYQAIYCFIVLAFSEEIIKYLDFRLMLKKTNYAYTWADVVSFMVIIGAGFGLIEDIPYAIGANPVTMLVRGVTLGHVGYGFLMGWFYGKKLFTGKKRYGVISFLLPCLLHGLYDYSLTPELIEFNDNLVAVAFGLVIVDIVLLVLMIRFFIRVQKHKDERYHQPLISVAENNAPAASDQS